MKQGFRIYWQVLLREYWACKYTSPLATKLGGGAICIVNGHCQKLICYFLCEHMFQRMETFWHWILVEQTSVCYCAECRMVSVKVQVVITTFLITCCVDQHQLYVYSHCISGLFMFVTDTNCPVLMVHICHFILYLGLLGNDFNHWLLFSPFPGYLQFSKILSKHQSPSHRWSSS